MFLQCPGSQQIRIRSRESKTEKGQKPRVKNGKETKTESQYTKRIQSRQLKSERESKINNRRNAMTVETLQKHEKHQPQQSPKLPTENSRKECSYVPAVWQAVLTFISSQDMCF